MHRDAILAAYDDQIRRHPGPDGPDVRVEAGDGVVCVIAGADGWSGVTWSDLSERDADAAIAATVGRFARLSHEWEWKHYSHDRPADLPERLRAAGLRPEPAEALLVAEIGALALETPPPPGVHVRAVADAAGVDALVAVHDEVFGEDHSGLGRIMLAGIGREPAAMTGVVAYAGAAPVAAARVEFHAGTDFASLWGGGTLPAFRHRGVFRSLVAFRARLAAERGFRYLQVDALPASRPILQQLGFVELATTTPFVHGR
jgi:hypothetical protein